MSELLTFNPVFPLWVSVAVAILAAALITILELLRQQKRLGIRLLSVLLLVSGLLGVLLRPLLPFETGTTIIRTPGATDTMIDSLMIIMPGSEVIVIDSTSQDLDLRILATIRDNVIIAGNGLPLEFADYLEGMYYKYIPGTEPTGVIELSFNDSYPVHQEGRIYGSYRSTDSTWLRLIGPAGTEDSAVIAPNASSHFSMSFTPREPGKYLYQLKESTPAGPTRTNTIPIVVKKPVLLRALLLFEYPSSEIRFLKNFLAGQGHQLTIRHKVSTDRYRTELVNNASDITTLSRENLEHFDLVITDQSSLANLSRSENNFILAGASNGLGVLILMNNLADKMPGSYFEKVEFSMNSSDTATIRINRETLHVKSARLQAANSISVLDERNGKAVQGYQQHGNGKIGYQLLQETFTLVLQGKEGAYAQLWSPVIEKLARKSIPEFRINSMTEFPIYPGDPYRFEVISSGRIPKVEQEGSRIPLREETFIDDVWNGTTWHHNSGWNAIQLQDSTQKDVFVSAKNEWAALRTKHQIKVHQRNEKISLENSSPVHAGSTPIPLTIFYFLLLAGFGFLWLSPKL